MNLSTSGGTIQLLFEDNEQYNSWRAFISYHMNQGRMLSYWVPSSNFLATPTTCIYYFIVLSKFETYQ